VKEKSQGRESVTKLTTMKKSASLAKVESAHCVQSKVASSTTGRSSVRQVIDSHKNDITKKPHERPASSKGMNESHLHQKTLIVKNEGEKKVVEKKSSLDRRVIKASDAKITKISSGIQKVSRNSVKALATSNTASQASNFVCLDKLETSKVSSAAHPPVAAATITKTTSRKTLTISTAHTTTAG
jgi:hypothetical protein